MLPQRAAMFLALPCAPYQTKLAHSAGHIQWYSLDTNLMPGRNFQYRQWAERNERISSNAIALIGSYSAWRGDFCAREQELQ